MKKGDQKTAVSPVNGQPVPKGGEAYRFVRGDSRAKAGQKKGVKTKKLQRTMAEIVKEMLCAPAMISESQKQKVAEAMGCKPDEVTNSVLANFAQLKKAIGGDLPALVYMRDTSGEKPASQIEVSEIPRIIDDIPDMPRNGVEPSD
ncbi:MAG: hypothetical protein PHY12_05710 [Eubacteriales bacterium]|nr:hypothetical protein [Eubacteriales bacterium]